MAPSSGNKNNAALIAVGSLVLLLGAAGLLFARNSGLLAASNPASPKIGVIAAPDTNAARSPLLNAPELDAPRSPAIAAPPTIGNAMPEDIIAYLRWLKWYEAERKKLESKGVAAMTMTLQDVIKNYTTGESLGLLDGSFENGTERQKPTMNYGAEIAKVVQEWNQAAGVFQQKTPPNPCAPLATNYGQALTSSIAEMTKLQGTLTKALGALSPDGNNSSQGSTEARSTINDLMQQKNTRSASKSIDALYGDANNALDSLRSRYTQIPADIDQGHFRIQADNGSLSLPGGIMGM
jgi:hypothetical protein